MEASPGFPGLNRGSAALASTDDTLARCTGQVRVTPAALSAPSRRGPAGDGGDADGRGRGAASLSPAPRPARSSPRCRCARCARCALPTVRGTRGHRGRMGSAVSVARGRAARRGVTYSSRHGHATAMPRRLRPTRRVAALLGHSAGPSQPRNAQRGAARRNAAQRAHLHASRSVAAVAAVASAR